MSHIQNFGDAPKSSAGDAAFAAGDAASHTGDVGASPKFCIRDTTQIL